VDGRSDLYSLGATLFQLLTGALPLRGDSMAALMYQIANQPAPSVRTLRPELPQELADILGKTLAKSPSERYQTGGELAADLRRVVAGVSLPTDADGAPGNVPVLAGRDEEDTMLATVVTPAPVSSTATESTSPDIRL
jgi:serine/threonine-protein kinase